MTNDILVNLSPDQAQIIKNNRQLVRLAIIDWWHENKYIDNKRKFLLELNEIKKWGRL